MRIAMWDIETTNLNALMGRVLCGAIYPLATEKGIDGKVKVFRCDRAPFKTDDVLDDSKLCIAMRDELEKYNMVVTWNGKLFDAPFLNARLALVGERPYQPQLHLDIMWYAAGSSLRIGSKKLVNVQKFFNVENAKTEIKWADWQRAAGGDKKAMNEVVTHCEQDVKVLGEVYWKLIGQVRNIHR